MTYEEIIREIEKADAVLNHFRELCNAKEEDNAVRDFLITQRDQLYRKWYDLKKQERQIIKEESKRRREESAV